LPEIGSVRVEVAAHLEETNSRLISVASKLPKQHNANRKAYFFNAIGPKRRFRCAAAIFLQFGGKAEMPDTFLKRRN
jgi:hypothetical protein